MIYEYFCSTCSIVQEVSKSMDYAASLEWCPSCNTRMQRLYSANVQLVGTKVRDPEYQPAFGSIVKNKRELKDLMKKHNVEEVGNEKPQTIHKHFDKVREEKRNREWEKV